MLDVVTREIETTTTKRNFASLTKLPEIVKIKETQQQKRGANEYIFGGERLTAHSNLDFCKWNWIDPRAWIKRHNHYETTAYFFILISISCVDRRLGCRTCRDVVRRAIVVVHRMVRAFCCCYTKRWNQPTDHRQCVVAQQRRLYPFDCSAERAKRKAIVLRRTLSTASESSRHKESRREWVRKSASDFVEFFLLLSILFLHVFLLLLIRILFHADCFFIVVVVVAAAVLMFLLLLFSLASLVCFVFFFFFWWCACR